MTSPSSARLYVQHAMAEDAKRNCVDVKRHANLLFIMWGSYLPPDEVERALARYGASLIERAARHLEDQAHLVGVYAWNGAAAIVRSHAPAMP